MRSSIRRSILWVLVCCLVIPRDAAGSDCGPALYRRVTAALKDPAFKEQARDWVRRFQAADDVTHRGMLKAAVHKDVKALKEGFRDLPVGANPFASEDEVYRVIGELTDDSYVGAPGLSETVGNLFADTSPNEKGALLTLRVADENRLASKVVPGNGAGLEQPVDFNNASRRYDMREPDPSAPAGIGGIVHENKNWTTPLDGPDDFRLTRFADEYRRDILIHSTSNWNHYRINLRTTVQGQGDVIRDRLLREFDSELVRNALPPGAIDTLKRRFQALWDAGDGGGLLKYY